jgi:tetratricopeptide (TPR) repeat protein
LESTLAGDPSNAEGRFYLGAALFKQNDLDGAIREWRQVATERPTHFPAVFALGALLGERQEYGEAQVWLKKAAGMRPDHADVQLELGKIAFKQEEYQAALRHLQAAAKLNPKSKTISFFLARSFQRLGRMDEAHAEFERRRNLPDDTSDLLGNAMQGSGAPGIEKPR